MDRQFYVYILASISRTLYIGFTSDLESRVWEHKTKAMSGFSGNTMSIGSCITRSLRVRTMALRVRSS
jgi:predicted GIY-YIG superfamily endonuclease